MEFRDADWAIVRELLAWGAENYPNGPLRISLKSLARRAQLHPNTVWSRLRAMRRGGALEGPVFSPLPAALGHFRSGFLFDRVPRMTAADLADALRPHPSVEWLVFAGSFAFIHFWHPGPSGAATARAIAHDLSAAEFVKGYASADFPPPPGPPPSMSAADWRLALGLRRQPGRSLAAVARDLGVASRTAERRAKALIDRGLGTMQARLHPAKVEGWILVEYIAWQGQARAGAGLARAFPDRLIGPFGPGTIPNVAVPVRNLAEMEARRAAAEALPGVGPVDARAVEDLLYPAPFEGWLESLVASSLAAR